MKKIYLILILFISFNLSLFSQKKVKEKTINYSISYLGTEYLGIYEGSTIKGKVDKKKVDLPIGKGNFSGYKRNSGVKNTLLSENYSDYLALEGKKWTSQNYDLTIENSSDLILETSIAMRRFNDNSGGALIRFDLNNNNKGNEFINCTFEEFKKEPYDSAVATLIDKSSYIAAKSAFRNIHVNGIVNGVSIDTKLKCSFLDYTKLNTLTIKKKGRIIEIYVNSYLEGKIDLGKSISIRRITLDKDETHDVYYDYLKISEIKYDPGDILSYSGNWLNGMFEGEGELGYNGGKIIGSFSLGNLNANGKAFFKNYFYEGSFKQGIPNGKGKIVTDNYEYSGDVQDWVASGTGKAILIKHQLQEPPISIIRNKHPYFEGGFNKGKINGQGTMHYTNGESLTGLWEGYLFTGTGKLTLADQSIYEGEWLKGKKEGKGKLILSDGITLVGDFVNDAFNGSGKMQLQTGGLYEGQIKDGKPFGKGNVTYASGHQITGNWNEYGFNGEGRKVYERIYSDGDEYCYEEGNWINDKLEGIGTKVFKFNVSEDGSLFDIAKYVGNFSNGYFNENGVLNYYFGTAEVIVTAKWTNGKITAGKVETYQLQLDGKIKSSYEGELIDFGTPHGYGELLDYDNSIYVGQFRNGLPNGMGKRTYENGHVEEGEFIEGEYKKPFECKTATIGNQIWMGENLKVTSFRNGDPIPEARSIDQWNEAASKRQPAFCYFNNDPSTAEEYGLLYNGYAVKDTRGLAPEGWRVPIFDDAKKLYVFLDNSILLDEQKLKQMQTEGYDYQALKVFEKEIEKKYGDFLVKRNGTSVWPSNPNFGQTKLRSKSGWSGDKQGTNTFGFNAKPTKSRIKGKFYNSDNEFNIWLGDFNKNSGYIYLFNVTNSGYSLPWANGEDRYNKTIFVFSRSLEAKDIGESSDGYPVRCIKN